MNRYKWGSVVVGLALVVLCASLFWRYWTGKILAENLVSFEAAENLRLQGDHQGATDLYQQLLERTRREPMLRIASLHGLALSLDALGKKEEACAFYKQAGADPQNVIASWSRFAEAECREGIGQQAEAEALYRTLTTSEENVPAEIKTQSEEKLKGLAAKP